MLGMTNDRYKAEADPVPCSTTSQSWRLSQRTGLSLQGLGQTEASQYWVPAGAVFCAAFQLSCPIQTSLGL